MAVYDSKGYIHVQSGDTISGYHMKLFGKWGVKADWEKHYARPPLGTSKTARTIIDFNKIDAGETLVYLPVWKPGPSTPGIVIPVTPGKGSVHNDIDTLVQRLQQESGMTESAARKFANTLFNVWDVQDVAITFSELGLESLGYMGYLTGTAATVAPAVEIAGQIAPFVGAALFTIGGLMAWIDARRFGLKFVSLRSMAYGITAFAFDDPSPSYPILMRENLGKGPYTDPTLTTADFRAEWNQTMTLTRQAMQRIAARQGTNELAVRASIMFAANSDRKRCAENFMYQLEKEKLAVSNIPWTEPVVPELVHMQFFSPKPDYPN